jgi:hypothetical protein
MIGKAPISSLSFVFILLDGFVEVGYAFGALFVLLLLGADALKAVLEIVRAHLTNRGVLEALIENVHVRSTAIAAKQRMAMKTCLSVSSRKLSSFIGSSVHL